MPIRRLWMWLLLAAMAAGAPLARAAFVLEEVYTNADGSVQYVVLREAHGTNGLDHLTGATLVAGGARHANTFAFATDLPSAATANKRVLIATTGYAALQLIPADYTIPDRFVPTEGGSLSFTTVDGANNPTVDWLFHPPLPTDGVNAFFASGMVAPNVATNFAGQSVSVVAAAVAAIEFYNAALDHYFVSSLAPDIHALDSGLIPGWSRTGRGFGVWPSQASGGPGVNPVCRFYIPPEHGNSHFFSASPAECAEILAKIGTDPSYSGYIYESPNAFYAALPDTATGACPAGNVPVHRLWNQRTDSNHRYTADPGIKAAMIAKGYLAEGYGPDAASLCSPGAVLVDALVRTSGLSTFAPDCDGVPVVGTVYVSAEAEPFIAVNPANSNNFIGVWQQDRWSNGGARGPGAAYSFDGGGTWARSYAPMSRCAGGNAGNGGDFERASDPWVTIAPDGAAYQAALGFNNQANGDNAILVARSTDGGRTWSDAVSLRRDGGADFNDKESITADPTDARYVYVVWDRLTNIHGPTWFARTTTGGANWEAARNIYDPGPNSQTINNQIVVLPDGTVIDFFTEIDNAGTANPLLRVIRSADKGATWSAPTTIATRQSVGTVDPDTGVRIRDGILLGSIAAGANGVLAAAWQDARFSGGAHDGVAFSRSTDGGLTWSAPLRINGNPAVPAFIPSVAIRSDGTIGVTYYDFRGNTPDPTTLWTGSWLTTSSDGVTWHERAIGEAFDYALAPRVANGNLFLGDYMGLAATGSTFIPFFAQTNQDSRNRSDIFAALVRAANPAAVARQARAVNTGPTTAAEPDAAIAARVRTATRNALVERLPEAVARRLTNPPQGRP